MKEGLPTPAAGWVRPPGEEATEADIDALAERAARLVERRHEERREWDDLLGLPVFRATTVLLTQGGGSIGPARSRDGRVMAWDLWAPHRRLLVDIFVAGFPPQEELEDRAAFAAEHGLVYAVVQPGERVSAVRIRELLERKESDGRHSDA